MKTKLLKKTRAYIRKYYPYFEYQNKESQHNIAIDVAVRIIEDVFYSWVFGFNATAYKILIKHKLFNKR